MSRIPFGRFDRLIAVCMTLYMVFAVVLGWLLLGVPRSASSIVASAVMHVLLLACVVGTVIVFKITRSGTS